MRQAGRLLVIAGIPGVGKSTLLEALERRGWRVLRGDEAHAWDEVEHGAWDRLIAGTSTELVAIAEREAKGLAIEWGFSRRFLPTITRWVEEGRDVWFLDGDREAAFGQWRSAHPHVPKECFDRQVAGLDAVAADISRLFGPRQLEVLRPGPSPVPVSEVISQMAAVAGSSY